MMDDEGRVTDLKLSKAYTHVFERASLKIVMR